MFDQPWLEGLTAEQRAAVLAPDGPVLLLAGAGTGKTRTLACRVARLLADGAVADRILLLTFTRRAAADLVDRARRMAAAADGGADQGRVTGGTFHAIGSRLLRAHGAVLGLAPSFTILDAADSADLLDLVRTDLGLAGRDRRFPRKETLAAIYSRTVNTASPLARVLTEQWPWCVADANEVAAVFAGYTDRKRELGVLDYDDLLLWWRALLDHPVAGARMQERFDHVLVDEYQDTNRLQAEILQRLVDRHRRITVVGDDAQAIYSFRSATVDNILRFPDTFPGAAVLRLEHNHRSTSEIVTTANAVMAGATERWDKTLIAAPSGARPQLRVSLDEQEQATAVSQAVLDRREDGVRLRDQAVLMRTGHHSAALEIELRRRGIPFVKYGGLRFLESAHVKDLLALLRLLDNPGDDLAWFRVLQWFEGVGPATARRLLGELRHGGADPLRRLVDDNPAVPRAAEEEFAGVRAALAVCRAGELAVAEEVTMLAQAYAPVCARRFDDAAVRMRDLQQLAAVGASAADRTGFLTDLVLDPPASTGDLAGAPSRDEDWLVLSTIHSAKGLEWDTVHVLGLVDGMLPSDLATGRTEEVDEERRLLYVAVTRAKRILVLHQPLRCYFQRFRPHDAHTYAQPSRFLDDRVLGTLDRTGAPPPAPVPATATPASVATFLDSLWQPVGAPDA